MKARIIKFIEGERPNRQYIVVGAARRGSGDATEGRRRGRHEKSSTRAAREQKSKGNNELAVQLMELTGDRTDVSFNYGVVVGSMRAYKITEHAAKLSRSRSPNSSLPQWIERVDCLRFSTNSSALCTTYLPLDCLVLNAKGSFS